MRKRYTKIICAALAAISACGLIFSSACSDYKWQAVSEKDTTAESVQSNGGFLVQTGDYAYFINGKTQNTDDNTFGSVLKGSVQRIKKSDLQAGNYSSTQTIVPSVIYSGQYNAGIYIYGDYIYYTTPSTQKDANGNVLNGSLDFRRTTLDGSKTDKNYLWQSLDNAVDYRFVEVKGTVYILYALAENLYGTSTTNIHSINCETGANHILAYNVDSYVFDTADAENPVVYYTMSVPYFVGESATYGYNQVYRVCADINVSERKYDFSKVDDYDAKTNPLYINYGDYVFDGIGTTQNQTEGRITQFNYATWSGKKYELTNAEYTYSLESYENGTLYFTRKSGVGSSTGNRYVIKDSEIDSTNDGRVDVTWDAVNKNNNLDVFLYLTDSTKYTYYEMDGKTYAFNTSSDGIMKGEVVDGIVENVYRISEASSATVLQFRKEKTSATEEHDYLYYSLSGGNGNTFYRIAVDGDKSDYNELPAEFDWDKTWTYRGVQILDLDACSDWYAPEFVDNTLVFASETTEMSAFNYIMACNLGKGDYMLTNKQLKEYKEKFEEITEKIEKYNEETNTDGSSAYENLANALKYLFYTSDEAYLDELIQAYVDIKGKDKEYLYSERTAEIYKEFASATGDWESYADDSKNFNGETVYANSLDYYYGVLGKMADSDKEALKNAFKSQYMQDYPEDTSTWWDKLGTGGRVGFIIGMVAAGLVVLGGLAVATIFIIRHIMKKKSGETQDSKLNVDITDDKDMNVYED